MRYIILVSKIVVFSLCAIQMSGCDRSAMKAAAMRDDEETCLAIGFKPGADDYKQCLLTNWQGRLNRAKSSSSSGTTCVKGFGYGANITNCY